MARSGEQTTRQDFTQIYKGSELVGEMIGNKYTSIKGSESPKLKSDNEWEMKDELISLGYTIKEVNIVIRKPINSSIDMLQDLGL